MSTRTPSKYQLNKWINLIWESHDMICSCSHATAHLLEQLGSKQEEIKLNNTTYKQLQKCLTTTEDSTVLGEDGFGPGDLDALFAADDFGTEEDNTG